MSHYYSDNNYLSVEIFFIRQGLLFGRHNEIIGTLGSAEDEVLEYLIKFYEKSIRSINRNASKSII